jgi:hypothetical protein
MGLIANEVNEKLVGKSVIARCAICRVEILPLPIKRYLLEICICFKISKRSKSTCTTFLILGFYSTFGGRTSRCSTPQSQSFVIAKLVSTSTSSNILDINPSALARLPMTLATCALFQLQSRGSTG